MLTIAPLWLILAAATPPAYAQASTDVLSPSSTPSLSDWTQFHRDNMQRWNPVETVLGVNDVAGLQLKWNYLIGNGLNDNVLSSPAVANGMLYFGSTNSNMDALDATTGAAKAQRVEVGMEERALRVGEESICGEKENSVPDKSDH